MHTLVSALILTATPSLNEQQREHHPHWKEKDRKNPVGLGLGVSDRGFRAFAVEVACGQALYLFR